MPYCHFELEDSDYIRSGRRNPELTGPNGSPPGTTLDPNTRVIEFQCMGVGVRTTKKFTIINPTNQNYTYEWVSEDATGGTKKVAEFVCPTPSGMIMSGKQTQVLV